MSIFNNLSGSEEDVDLYSQFIIVEDEVEEQTQTSTLNVNLDAVDSEDSPLSWTNVALQYLVNRRVELDDEFRSSKTGKKIKHWERISSELKKMGFSYTSKQCDDKFRTLKTHYTKVHDKSKKSGSGKITWPHYALMEKAMRDMGRKQAISPPLDLIVDTQFSTGSNILNNNQAQSSISTKELEITTDDVTSTKRFKCGSMVKEKQPLWVKEFLSTREVQNREILKRLDKSDERDSKLLEVQNQLLKKLDRSNAIEEEKLEFFKKIFN